MMKTDHAERYATGKGKDAANYLEDRAGRAENKWDNFWARWWPF
jgi:hypothetical protein